jgi:hypothetical protein
MTSTTHAPGDRVRIQHDPSRDAGYLPIGIAARRKLNGAEGVIRERSIPAMFRVEARGDDAWFAHDELSPIATDPDGFEVGAPAAQPAPVLPAPSRGALVKAQRLQEALDDLASTVDDAQVLRAACEALTGTVGLPAPELAKALLATVAAELEVGREERARASRAREQARARLHEGDPAAVKP